MARILLNGEDCTDELGPSAPASWGDLLAVFDERLQDAGQIVTGVRFDGIDEPAFREPVAMARHLEAHAVLEIESGLPSTLLERCLDEAGASVPQLVEGARELSVLFRTSRFDEANRALADLCEGIGTLMAIIGACSLALRIDLHSLECEELSVGARISTLRSQVETLIAAQRNHDWETIADVLEDGVTASLAKWPAVLQSLLSIVRGISRGVPSPRAAS